MMVLSDTPDKCTTSHILFFPLCARSYFQQPCKPKYEGLTGQVLLPQLYSDPPSCAPAVSCLSQPRWNSVQYTLVKILARHFEHPPGLVCDTHTPWSNLLLCVRCHLYQLFTVPTDLIMLMVWHPLHGWLGEGKEEHKALPMQQEWCKHRCCPINTVLTSEIILPLPTPTLFLGKRIFNTREASKSYQKLLPLPVVLGISSWTWSQ